MRPDENASTTGENSPEGIGRTGDDCAVGGAEAESAGVNGHH